MRGAVTAEAYINHEHSPESALWHLSRPNMGCLSCPVLCPLLPLPMHDHPGAQLRQTHMHQSRKGAQHGRGETAEAH